MLTLIAQNFLFPLAFCSKLLQFVVAICLSQSLQFAGLGSVLLSQHAVYIPELLMVFLQTRNLYLYCEKNLLVSQICCIKTHRLAARNTQRHTLFLYTLAIQRACQEDWASAAMHRLRCSPRPTDRLHRDPLNGSEKHRDAPRFCVHALAMQHASL